MEYTASINIEHPLDMVAVRTSVQRLAGNISPRALLLFVQAVCCFVQMRAGHGVLCDTVAVIAVLSSITGIYWGLHKSDGPEFVRGKNCATVSALTLLFCMMQMIFRTIPLFV